MADFMGSMGAFVYAVQLLGIDWHHYIENSQRFVGAFDVFAGVFKSLFFGSAIALIACHRGFHCQPGAEGVGRAATKAFVASFVAIMVLNLLLGIFLDGVYYSIWPEAPKITG
jgi:phospholipid/cholesterol/gamma-HCH transport system permease protein